MSQQISAIYSLPPSILSQDVSQSYWQWSGQIPSTTAPAPPTSPSGPSEAKATFSASTNELDKYRVIFLIVGVLIGAYVLGKR